MKAPSSRQLGFALVGLGVLFILSFQNCSVRRLDGTELASGTLNGRSSGQTGQIPTPTPSRGGASCPAGNLQQANTQGTLIGTADAANAVMRTTYARMDRDIEAKILFVLTSACVTKTHYTTATSACYTVTLPHLHAGITINCSSDKNSTTCENYTEGETVDLTVNNDKSRGITFNAAYYSSAGAKSYVHPTMKKGTIKFVKLPTLANGSVVQLELKDFEFVDTGDNTKTFKFDGTYSAEIVTKSCSAGL
jgi:hypothetical protein